MKAGRALAPAESEMKMRSAESAVDLWSQSECQTEKRDLVLNRFAESSSAPRFVFSPRPRSAFAAVPCWLLGREESLERG